VRLNAAKRPRRKETDQKLSMVSRESSDNEGNRTRRTKISDGTVTDYTWDYRNRLTNVTERATVGGAAVKSTDFVYDVNNRLVRKVHDPDGAGEQVATTECFAYDGQQVLLRFDGPQLSDLADRYLWGPAVDYLLSDEQLTSPTTPGTVYWALTDHLNTVRDLALYDFGTDTTSVANHRVYDAYGNLTDETNAAVDCLFGYTGRQFDEATGLQNNLNRWYDPKVGRWLREDPIGFQGRDANLYRYVGNSPTIHRDPFGVSDDDESLFYKFAVNFWGGRVARPERQ